MIGPTTEWLPNIWSSYCYKLDVMSLSFDVTGRQTKQCRVNPKKLSALRAEDVLLRHATSTERTGA